VATLDARLRFMLGQDSEASRSLAFDSAFEDVGESIDAAPRVEVLLRCDRDIRAETLNAFGFDAWYATRGAALVVSGTVVTDALTMLSLVGEVSRIEASRQMDDELDLSCVEIGARTLQAASPPISGGKVIVGIIDSGIDYTHAHFRHANGTSRIQFLWDMAGVPDPNGTVKIGREYTKAELDAALASADPFAAVPHRDGEVGHGTHVAGIAAGDGSGAGGAHTGVAPAADLIVVRYRGDGSTLGRSVRASAAVSYIVEKAQGVPVVINLSQGMNGGGHCGETLLEEYLDNVCRDKNVVVVKSAGNEQALRPHAGGRLVEGQSVALEFSVHAQPAPFDTFEIWSDGEDRISVSVQPPTGPATAFISDDTPAPLVTAFGNRISAIVEEDASSTGDRLTTILIERGQGGAPLPEAGAWHLILRGDQILNGRYDVWIERTSRQPTQNQTRFVPSSTDSSRTISIPGTARRVITVGSYVTRLRTNGTPTVGDISTFSSRGPTRYNLIKPEICAPGEDISSSTPISATAPAGTASSGLVLMSGTSMATPHVTGAAALVLSVRPGLTCEQVKQILVKTAKRDAFSMKAPDNTWGHGKLDAEKAAGVAPVAVFPTIVKAEVNGSRVTVETDILTTAAVQFGRHAQRLRLGRGEGRRVSQTLSTLHDIDLAGLPAGRYFCEVRVMSGAGWWTEDDAAGQCYVVDV
jgi:subtilisin family serine protease